MKRTFIPALWLLAGVLGGAAMAADELGTDELSQTGTVQPIIWEPVIAEFSIVPLMANVEQLKIPPPGKGATSRDVLGEANQWNDLKSKVRVRVKADGAPEPYGPQDLVFSSWRRVLRDDGTVVFEVIGPYGKDGKPLDPAGGAAPPADLRVLEIFNAGGRLSIPVQLDVLMNAPSAEFKDDKVRNYFKLLELSITAHKVSDDPADVRAPVRADDEQRPPILQIGSPEETIGQDLTVAAGVLGAAWDPAGKVGVFELRIKARVLGRLRGTEEAQVKTVAGAVRLAFVAKNFVPQLMYRESSGSRTGGPPAKKP